jgi:hypothetical protein
MDVPAPRHICAKVSALAAKKARESARSFGWSDKTIEALVPMPGEDGKVGVHWTKKYIGFQVRGTRPFLMTWVEGRTLPMGCRQGDGPHFRRGSHVGEPGYVNIPHVGRVYREQRWRHPGIKPKPFIEKAINDAIAEMGQEVQAEMMKSLFGGAGDDQH